MRSRVFFIPSKSDLRIDSKHSPIGFTLAMFHTAPVVNVDMPGGKIERMVIDPSLFDEPVSVARWSTAMRDISGAPCETLFLPRFAFHISDRDDPPSAWRERDMADARSWSADYKVVEEDMLKSGFYDHLKELVAKS